MKLFNLEKLEIPVTGKKEPDILIMTEYKNGDISY
jgi:hypothetical protein